MIFTLFSPTKCIDITFCSMYTVWRGCLTEHAPHALRRNWHIFHSSSSGTGQINWFQNLTYSSGKSPDPHQKGASPFALNPVWISSASAHILPPAEFVCPCQPWPLHLESPPVHPSRSFSTSLFCLLNCDYLAPGQNLLGSVLAWNLTSKNQNVTAGHRLNCQTDLRLSKSLVQTSTCGAFGISNLIQKLARNKQINRSSLLNAALQGSPLSLGIVLQTLKVNTR